MTWNPASGIAMFEPGCIRCAKCGQKPEDPWDDAPEGFEYNEGWWCVEHNERGRLEDAACDRDQRKFEEAHRG
jgi:hypothetical protein